MECPLCGEKEPFEVIDELEFELVGKPTFIRPVMCGGCGLVFLNPPTEQSLLFDYYTAQDRYPSETAAYREQVEMIAEHFKKGAVLDIGSYDGRLLYELSNEFLSSVAIYGVEPDKTVKPIIDYVQWENFATVYLLGLEFDLITMGHVLEHLPDALEMLEMCRVMLTRKGLLFIEVPNLCQPQVQLEPYWTAQHLWYFSTHALEALLMKAGFEVVETQLTDYNAIRVIAKPGKPSQKQLDPGQTRKTIGAYYRAYWKELGRIKDILTNVQGRIAVFGAGEHSRWLAKTFPAFWDGVEFILDSNPTKWGIEFLGRQVVAPNQLPGFIDSVVISSYDTQEEMAEVINKMPGGRAVKLYKSEHVKAYDAWA